MKEKQIEDRLVSLITRSGGKALKLELNGLRGFPDRLLLAKGGLVCFVETKAKGGKLSAPQKVWANTLRGLGFRVEVPSSIDEVEALAADFLKGRPRAKVLDSVEGIRFGGPVDV